MKIFSVKYFACKIFYFCKYFMSKQTERKFHFLKLVDQLGSFCLFVCLFVCY